MKRLWLSLLVFVFVNPVLAKGNPVETISKLLPLFIKDEQVGMFFADGLEKQYGLANDPAGLQRVQKIADRIIAVTQSPDAQYNFGILASNKFNACSIYGRKIRVFQGLLSDTRNSDSELAAVLAHEIAHQELGHNKEMVKNFKVSYALDLANITKKTPQLLIAGANAVLAKRSRKLENRADLQSLEWLKKSGFPITGQIAVMRRIEAEHKVEEKKYGNNLSSQKFDQIFATHPEPKDRVETAEDSLLEQKYGRTFQEDEIVVVKKTTDLASREELPIIVAHPSLWETPLTITDKVSGVGVFNPDTAKRNLQKDVDFCLDITRQGHLICITGDNDFHAMPTATLNLDYTFVDIGSVELSRRSLISAINAGRTYASSKGVRIAAANFKIGSDYPKIQKVQWQLTLDLPLTIASAPKIKVYRNGQEVAELKKINSQLERQSVYQFSDDNLAPGLYWYVLYIPDQLVTSPITCEITNNSSDPIDFPNSSSWHKGIIHCHSLYSDGKSTLADIWSSRNNDVEFIFMTDHADAFDEAKFQKFVNDCHNISPLLIPGIEYSLSGGKLRHLLVLGQETYNPDFAASQDEGKFFDINNPDKLLIEKGPFHLGDDVPNSEIHKDATFDYNQQDATLKLRVKGTPNKDPILWINRIEIGRVVTTDNQWHWYEFRVPKSYLKAGQNLFHIQSYIPDRWQTFDDCEVADVYILKN